MTSRATAGVVIASAHYRFSAVLWLTSITEVIARWWGRQTGYGRLCGGAAGSKSCHVFAWATAVFRDSRGAQERGVLMPRLTSADGVPASIGWSPAIFDADGPSTSEGVTVGMSGDLFVIGDSQVWSPLRQTRTSRVRSTPSIDTPPRPVRPACFGLSGFAAALRRVLAGQGMAGVSEQESGDGGVRNHRDFHTPDASHPFHLRTET